MYKEEEEVVPDSQDEVEIRVDSSPPPEQHHLTSPSVVPPLFSSCVLHPAIPRPSPAAPSTISQFTTTATGVTAAPSTISVSSSSSSSSSKPRPKPRPLFARRNPSLATDASDPVASPPAPPTADHHHHHHTPPALPPAQHTFSADISERIKARRASQVQMIKYVEDPVIDISSDDDDDDDAEEEEEEAERGMSPPPRSRARTRRPKAKAKAQSPRPHGAEHTIHAPPSLPSLKRKCSRAELDAEVHVAVSAQPPPKKRKKNQSKSKKSKKNKTAEETGFALETKGQEEGTRASGKAKPGSKPREKEQEQFKSREFIEDSDDELALGTGDSVTEGAVRAPGDAVPSAMLPQAHLPAVKAEPAREGNADGAAEPDKLRAGDSLEDSSIKNASVGQARHDKRKKREDATNNQKKITVVREEPTEEAHESEQTPDAQNDPIVSNPKRRKIARRIIVDEDEGEGQQDGVEAKEASALMENEQSRDIPKDPKVSNSKRKRKAGRVAVEDEGEGQQDDVEAKENVVPATPKSLASKPAVTPLSNTARPPHHKNVLPHPPKNRPLSSILQLVNGSSPRFRASPSVSRTLLGRIAPLHPNRRTPPPPPPPRVVPKKTKKELEREEKWEEELQETVEGWCELGEEERARMRRAKRDWELGLCEE